MSGHRHSPPGPGQHEHEFEAAHGLPERLPAGEQILWQGSPDWLDLARRTFHVRKLVVYFAALLLMRGAFAWTQGESIIQASRPAAVLVSLGLLALGMLLLMAWLTSRTTVYTITNHRVVMRIGIVLSMTLNLPFKRIAAADMRRDGSERAGPDAAGDIAIKLAAGDKIAYLHLWPHARPWRMAQPEPMMRSLPQAARVAAVLAQAWSQATGQTATPAVAASAADGNEQGLRHAGPQAA